MSKEKALDGKQRLVYNWLRENPGYLKKGRADAWSFCPEVIQFKRFNVVLNKARKDFKELYIKTPKKIKLRSLKEIFPWIKNEKTVSKPKDVAFKKDVSNLSKLRTTPGNYFITGCAHAPWHNKGMYESVLNYLSKEVELQGLILAGDIVDLNSLSSHDKGKKPLKGVTLDWEYEEANLLMNDFDGLDVVSKDYIFGNHEDRYSRYMSDINNSKLGKSLMSPEVGLKLRERGYNFYRDWKNDCISLGNHLDVTHGEFINVHTAKKTIDTYRKSTLYFHTHRFQIYIEGLVGGFNMGLGADIDADIFGYATRAMKKSWFNSACVVNLDKEGFYHVQPLMYINNKLIVNGRQY